MSTAKERLQQLRQQRLEEQKEHERKVRESHEAERRRLEQVEREREREREPTEFGDFAGFILLSIITLGIYAAYHFWKRARVDTNLLRAILSNQETTSSDQTIPAPEIKIRRSET